MKEHKEEAGENDQEKSRWPYLDSFLWSAFKGEISRSVLIYQSLLGSFWAEHN